MRAKYWSSCLRKHLSKCHQRVRQLKTYWFIFVGSAIFYLFLYVRVTKWPPASWVWVSSKESTCKCKFSRLVISLRRVQTVLHEIFAAGETPQRLPWSPRGRILRAMGQSKAEFILLLQAWGSHNPQPLSGSPPFPSVHPDEDWQPLISGPEVKSDLTTKIWQILKIQYKISVFFHTWLYLPCWWFRRANYFSLLHGDCVHGALSFLTLGPIFALCSYFQTTSFLLFKKLRLSLFSTSCSLEESS